MERKPAEIALEEVEAHCLSVQRKLLLLDKTGLLTVRLRLKEIVAIVEAVYNGS